MLENGGVALVSSILGPFTYHVAGCETIRIIVNLDLSSKVKTNMMHPARISLMLDIMHVTSIQEVIEASN